MGRGLSFPPKPPNNFLDVVFFKKSTSIKLSSLRHIRSGQHSFFGLQMCLQSFHLAATPPQHPPLPDILPFTSCPLCSTSRDLKTINCLLSLKGVTIYLRSTYFPFSPTEPRHEALVHFKILGNAPVFYKSCLSHSLWMFMEQHTRYY